MKYQILILILSTSLTSQAQISRKDSIRMVSLIKQPTYHDYRKQLFYAGIHMEKASTFQGFASASALAGLGACVYQGVRNTKSGTKFSNAGFYVGGGLALLGLALSYSGSRHIRKAGEILYFSTNKMPPYAWTP